MPAKVKLHHHDLLAVFRGATIHVTYQLHCHVLQIFLREEDMNIGMSYKPKAARNKPVGLLAALSLSRQPVDAHMQILAGYPYDIVSRLSTETQIDERTICQWAGISRSTYHRKNKEDKAVFSVEQSGKLYLLAKALDAAQRLLNGDMTAAIHWLKTPARALDGECPLNMLTTPMGAEAVIDLIGRIEHGVIS